MAIASYKTSSGESASSLPARLDTVTDVVRAEAGAGDEAGRLTEASLSALHSLGLFGLLAPRCYGGWEASAVDAVRVWEAISEADGAAGWVLMACCSGTGVCSALLPDSAAEIMFGDHIPMIGGQGAPRGKARVDGEGYRLSGRWGYGSGTLHAEYVMSSAMVVGDDGATLGARVFVVPADQVEFVGNWDVLGLRATGSVDYEIHDAAVTREFSFGLDTREPLRGGGLIRAGIAGATPLGHTAFALGVGRRILKDIAALANGTDGRPSALADGVGEGFQEAYGAAEGRLRAARAWTYEICADIDTTLSAGEPLSTRQISLIRLALYNATEAASGVADFAFRAAGGVSLRKGALQRSIRDIWAGSQHRVASNFMLRECAREILGMAKGQIWMNGSGGGLVNAPVAAVPRQ